MNKVFKVIWSEARNAYVVVSEIAKNHGSKSCSTKKLLTMLIATGVMTCASMAPAMADNPASDDANKGWNLSVNNGITAGTEVQPGGYVNFNGDEGNIIVSATKEFFGPSVQVKLSRDLNVDSIHAGEFFMNNDMGIGFGGDAYITQSGLNANGKVITNVAAGTKATDAVNVGQLNSAVAESGWKLATNGAVTDLKEIKNNAIVNFEGDENIGVSNETVDGINTVKVELNKDLKVNQVNAGDYFFDAERGVGFGGDAYITKNGLNANDKVITNVAEGVYNTDAVNVGQLKKVEEVAANANKGRNLSTNGVATKATNVAPGEIVDFSGDKNISVSHDGTKVQVELNKDIDVNYVQTNALNAKYNLSVGTANENGTVPFFVNSNGAFYGANGSFVVDKDGNVTAGNVVLNNGVHIGNSALRDGELFVGDASGNYSQITTKGAKLGKVTVAADGKISGVAAGAVTADSTDAVNGSQLYKTNQEVVNNTNRINKLGSRVNKVGAGAAALAALHPMDFDPDDKLTFSAGYGNYAGENAAAIGAYYRPDEKVMFSVAGTVGNGENMVNAGVSFALDRTNHVSNSRTALAREVIDLRGQLAVMGAKMAKMEKAFGMLDETKTKLFPDVPANHWAYEYIAKLAGNGYIEGYPDGNFGGDRLMTRYEFAAMLYRAIENGAALEEKIIKEFEPELGRIRVDRISGEDGDRDKIERVRVNDTKGERDHYGNKLAK